MRHEDRRNLYPRNPPDSILSLQADDTAVFCESQQRTRTISLQFVIAESLLDGNRHATPGMGPNGSGELRRLHTGG